MNPRKRTASLTKRARVRMRNDMGVATMAGAECVYVVMAGEGEYSDRLEWVCGVFTKRAEAMAQLEAHDYAAKEAEVRHAAWWKQWREVVGGMPTHPYGFPRTPPPPLTVQELWTAEQTQADWSDRQQWDADVAEMEKLRAEWRASGAAFRAQHGEPPPWREAGTFWIVEVPLNQWGRWSDEEEA